MTKLFISYAHNDTYIASGIIALLRRRYGHAEVWFDEELSNRGGSDWWQEILKAIKEADVFVYLLSDDSVKSPYCQAEFQEAQRLQKPFVLVQVRDNTKLPENIAARQYIDMKSGAGDATLAISLVNSIDHQKNEAKRNPKPLWVPATLRPNQGEITTVRENPGIEVDTPTLQLPKAPVNPRTLDFITQVASGIVAAIIAGIILALVLRPPDSANQATPSSTATTAVIGQLPTPTATPPLAPPTDLPIELVVGTLDAESTLQQATANEQATFSARATVYAVGTQSIADQTATATLWTSTPTPNVTASIEAFRTQRAATETQAWVDSWTATPTLTLTPTNTVTPTLTTTPTSIATLSPEQIALTAVTSNAAWQPYITEFAFDDGVTMVLVPAGCFEMGSNDGENDEKPVNQQCFTEPFWIDKYEVTQEQFAALGGQKAEDNYFKGDNLPVETITWTEARDYCKLRGGRLPTEAEWEYAARGPDNLVYPWGNEFVADNVVYAENSDDKTANVGSRPAGVSWVGALDLSGNVWEWTLSEYKDYPYDANDGRNDATTNVNRVLRGGSWNYTNSSNLRGAYRVNFDPLYSNFKIGFRCSRFD